MIDLHCHILPGLDDGSRSINESVEMARALVAAGFTSVVATPHVITNQYPNLTPQILAAADLLRRALDEAGVKLEVLTGGEYYFDRSVTDLAREYQPISGLCGSYYILVELPVMNMPAHLDYSVWPKEDDPPELRHSLPYIRPVIAHPERNQKLLHDPNLLHSLRELGYSFQVNLEAVVGLGGKKVVKFVRQMAKEKLIDFLGSDGHSAGGIGEVTDGWQKHAEKVLGPDVMQRVLIDNPDHLIRNEPIDFEDDYR
jgi:protein-tyrosine phosphatase